MKMASEYFNWLQIFIIGSVITVSAALILYVYHKPSIHLKLPAGMYLLIGAIIGVIALVSFYAALCAGKAVLVVPLTALYPVVTITLSYLILHEKVSVYQGCGITFAIIALILMALE
jgi:transporter family protein